MVLDERILAEKEVRLFPSHNIKNDREAEIRATAAFLAVTRAVSEFGRAIVSKAGGPSGKLRSFSEVPFLTPTGSKPIEDRPDGLLRVTRGKTDWSALVEVKVGDNPLEQEQFDKYHVLACDHGIDAFITISNQSPQSNGLPPLSVDKRRRVPTVHLSWEWLLSEAQLLSRREEVADADQQWILGEWIRYLTDPQSRIISQPQMGEYWNDVLRCAHEGDLNSCKNQMLDVVKHWDAFLRKVALRLRAKLGVNVEQRIPRAEQNDPELRIKNLHIAAISDGVLHGSLKIPDAAGDLSITLFLKSRSVQYSIEVAAPTEGKTATRIGWILKTLNSQETPNDLLVKVFWDPKRIISQKRFSELKEKVDLKEQVERLLWDVGAQKVPADASPRMFCLLWTIPLPKGKGASSAPVLEGIDKGVEDFYKHVVEGLRPYVPKAPQLPKDEHKWEDIATSNVDLTHKQPLIESEAPTTPPPMVESEKKDSEGRPSNNDANNN